MSRLNALLVAVRPLYASNDRGHDLAHALRVARLCEYLAEREGGDLAVLLPAALCHDLRRWEAPSHSGETGALVAELLRGAGYREDEGEAILTAVRRHSFDAPQPPETLEEQILFDADKLEGLGAIGIGRCFAVSGKLDQPIVGGGRATAQAMLGSLMRRYRDRLHTETARELAAARHDFLLAFIAQLETELAIAGKPPRALEAAAC